MVSLPIVPPRGKEVPLRPRVMKPVAVMTAILGSGPQSSSIGIDASYSSSDLTVIPRPFRASSRSSISSGNTVPSTRPASTASCGGIIPAFRMVTICGGSRPRPLVRARNSSLWKDSRSAVSAILWASDMSDRVSMSAALLYSPIRTKSG